MIVYFKAYYRKGLVKKLISDFFDKRFSEATTLSLLSCVLLAKLARNDIKSESIKNCFKKSRFNRVNQNEQGQEHEEREEHETANDHLQTYALLANTEVGTFSEFVNADNSLTISNQLNLELINKHILNEIQQYNDEYDSETETDELQESTVSVTINHVKKSIEIIKNYILNNENSNKNLILIDQLEISITENHLKKSKQSLISNYFRKSSE